MAGRKTLHVMHVHTSFSHHCLEKKTCANVHIYERMRASQAGNHTIRETSSQHTRKAPVRDMRTPRKFAQQTPVAHDSERNTKFQNRLLVAIPYLLQQFVHHALHPLRICVVPRAVLGRVLLHSVITRRRGGGGGRGALLKIVRTFTRRFLSWRQRGVCVLRTTQAGPLHTGAVCTLLLTTVLKVHPNSSGSVYTESCHMARKERSENLRFSEGNA